MATKIPVTKTMDGSEWLLFDEEDVRKACALQNCEQEMIDDCIESMRDGENDCECCFANLINIVKACFEYATDGHKRNNM